ncbi:c-Myc-binding protein-like isoform X2 [Nerophis ophidion]|uniref:c-Myc-binding protein-like isoform X2 n=1 Tax=Nerophis ophidion TaxID=159077 RepID=UPI002AE05DCA|nr:c-Myc-binding protein-like isoform X2 [Nerophis ophidion]
MDHNKRKQFRRYLHHSGVINSLTSALVALYEESDKPDDAMNFVMNHLSAQLSEALILEKTELRRRCERLTEENEELRSKLLQYETPP